MFPVRSFQHSISGWLFVVYSGVELCSANDAGADNNHCVTRRKSSL